MTKQNINICVIGYFSFRKSSKQMMFRWLESNIPKEFIHLETSLTMFWTKFPNAHYFFYQRAFQNAGESLQERCSLSTHTQAVFTKINTKIEQSCRHFYSSQSPSSALYSYTSSSQTLNSSDNAL